MPRGRVREALPRECLGFVGNSNGRPMPLLLSTISLPLPLSTFIPLPLPLALPRVISPPALTPKPPAKAPAAILDVAAAALSRIVTS